jgi:hypothetical protein
MIGKYSDNETKITFRTILKTYFFKSLNTGIVPISGHKLNLGQAIFKFF